jgi:23S rRNA A2030 N6-methylase RlmJ
MILLPHIIQPPYKLDEELRTTLPILGDLLKQNEDDHVSCSAQIFPISS